MLKQDRFFEAVSLICTEVFLWVIAYFKYITNLKTLGLGGYRPHFPVGYAPGGNRVLIAGYSPAQEFVIERSLSTHRFGN